MDNLDETAARLGKWLKNSAMGEWSVFTKNEAGDQEIIADDPNDDIPWTVAQFAPGEGFADGIVLMKNALPALLAERSADKAEIARLRDAEHRCPNCFVKFKKIDDVDEFVNGLSSAQPLPPGDGHE